MAKAKLNKVTEDWIDGKTEKQKDVKDESHKDAKQKTKKTVYISKEASKLLWHNRAETGKPISHTIEELVLKHLEKD